MDATTLHAVRDVAPGARSKGLPHFSIFSLCVCVGGGGHGAGERASLAKSTSDVNYSLKNAREGSKRRSV